MTHMQETWDYVDFQSLKIVAVMRDRLLIKQKKNQMIQLDLIGSLRLLGMDVELFLESL